MELAEGIKKIGFRRWYERQLIEGHLFLVSGILCLFTTLACVEGFTLRAPGWEPLVRLTGMIGGVFVCLWTLRRYLTMLGFAEYAAERSVCGKCDAYRGLELGRTVERGVTDPDDAADESPAPVGVRCRKCGHEWTIG